MENAKTEKEVKKQELVGEEEKKQNYKIIRNKTKANLLNMISFLIYNKNNFEEKLKPSDLDITLETSSSISTYKEMKYKMKLNYASFNPKRDLIKNIKLYKSFPAELEMKDEYYNTDFENIMVDIYPKMRKGIKLDLSEFPLYSYENKILNKDIKNEIKNSLDCKENQFILCVYLQDFDNSDSDIIQMIENVIETDMYDQYFKSTLIIIQVQEELQIQKIASMEILQKYLEKNDNLNNNKKKLKFVFNSLSNYKSSEKNDENFINIFQEKGTIFSYFERNNEKNYFFILDNSKTIIKLKPLKEIGKILTFLLLKFKKYKNNGENISIYKEKENEKEEKIKEAKKLIHFICYIKKLDLNYIFDLRFKIFLTLNVNDELNQIKLKNINKLFIDGTFFTKEYNYLKQICEFIKSPKLEYNLTELQTIDVEIDFTNMECEKCKKKISEQEYLYYCYICKLKYCYDCVQNQLKNNEGKKKYIDQKHNLIFFKTRDKNQFLNLEISKLGKNRFAETSEDNLGDWNSTTCNGCRGSLRRGQERYVCIHCRKGRRLRGGFVDYCSDCIKKMCKNKSDMVNLQEKANEVLDNWENDFMEGFIFKVEHNHENHIYLMMPFSIRHGEDRDYYFF